MSVARDPLTGAQAGTQDEAIVDNLELLLACLPGEIVGSLRELATHEELAAGRDGLLEIVLDLGRRPEARLTTGDVTLLEREITDEDLNWVISRIGDFGGDNRAGIERTLHRISAIRNRADRVVGLTCRVGRSVFGTIEILRDHIEAGRSILIMGRPGVGKTTMLREAARVLASEFSKRVVVVDTSNEIAGDGDIPHPAIGKARRMQVSSPERQHLVMIEAVENHMPEVIVIDEIGTEAEAIAARTIAERGVQLIGTAHGNSLENLMLNPTLTDLIGGIQTVTLGDDEARRRRTQKSVLERKAPPTFDVIVEIIERDHILVHEDVAATVDAMLRGDAVAPEERWRDEGGVRRSQQRIRPGQQAQGEARRFGGLTPADGRGDWRGSRDEGQGGWRRHRDRSRRAIENVPGGTAPAAIPALDERGGSWRPDRGWQRESMASVVRDLDDEPRARTVDGAAAPAEWDEAPPADDLAHQRSNLPELRILAHGISRKKLEVAIRELGLPASSARGAHDADVVVTLRNEFKQQGAPLVEAEGRGIPIHVLKSNAAEQMERALLEMYHLAEDPREEALREARTGVTEVQRTAHPVELAPQNAYIRRLQHQVAGEAGVTSSSRGRDPHRRVRLEPAGRATSTPRRRR
ncbi:MAG: AAA family ATPase [Chloroflexi bacterium]|jgi:stage III sporulation protein SpoIIIAA|nr:MAG: AAA family ATPase [Chloroflexota bacterium]